MLSVGDLDGSLAGRPALYLVIYIDGRAARFQEAPRVQNIYVFIYKGHLEQRGSCVVQRGSSSVESNAEVAKHICFCIQMALGGAWFLRGSAWFQQC